MHSVLIERARRTGARQNVQREAREQAMLFNWARRQTHQFPGIKYMFATLNGAYLQGDSTQRKWRWLRLRAEGAHEGVSDVFLPVARGTLHGLWLEMKAPRAHGPRVSDAQKVWLDAMRAQGYGAFVAYGYQEASDIIRGYYALGAHKCRVQIEREQLVAALTP